MTHEFRIGTPSPAPLTNVADEGIKEDTIGLHDGPASKFEARRGHRSFEKRTTESYVSPRVLSHSFPSDNPEPDRHPREHEQSRAEYDQVPGAHRQASVTPRQIFTSKKAPR